MAQLVGEDGNWSGGQDTLVQTGDIVDRGPDTIALYNLFAKLRTQAKEAGGKVINIYGNPEKRKAAWDVRTGWLGSMIFSNFNISYVHHGHTIFSHGDMEPEWARLGIDTLNQIAHEAIWNSDFHAPIFQNSGPIWSRVLAMEEGGTMATCRRIEEAKKALGVKRMISGHTPQHHTGKILSLCNGSYMVIDVGISTYYGAHVAALEIYEHEDGGQSVYALYPDGRWLLSTTHP
ncbi:hypothetical protein BGZ65_009173 [Modicella reniformis]|uniref:Calcineurin-like phosphoesterase domain-containing protein n=1 Tax=Modicella reniformis TaxID=1440133 RepID=A0A9P6II43_9FUNG|nr:hypothetical protein BGZ65_009173 [Modicella reniformis]